MLAWCQYIDVESTQFEVECGFWDGAAGMGSLSLPLDT